MQAVDQYGRTPFLYAMLTLTDAPSVQLFMKARPDLINVQDVFGDTPLMLCIEINNQVAATELIASPFLLPDIQNRDGYNALMFAAWYGYTEIAKSIIKEITDEVDKISTAIGKKAAAATPTATAAATATAKEALTIKYNVAALRVKNISIARGSQDIQTEIQEAMTKIDSM